MADYAGAVAAIELKLSTEWTTTPVAFENIEPPDLYANGELTAWASCEVVSDEAAIRGVGTPGQRVVIQHGAIEVTVFAPIGTGGETARGYAVAIGEIFRTKEFYKVSPGACVRTWTPEVRSGRRANTDNPVGSWWAVAVSIPFEFFQLA